MFSVPPGAPFLETLSDALLEGVLVEGFSRADRPLGLAAATIYVPTRRSARALAATLAQRLGSPSALLPRIVPLGALDDTELLFEDSGVENALAPDLPLAIGDIARRMILTRLILAWGEAVRHAILSVDGAGERSLSSDEPLHVATSPADAWHLSGELAALIDELTIEDVAWTRMAPLGTAEFDRYWRITLDFLDIAIAQYPSILAERGQVDRATRQVLLIEAEVARLAAGRAKDPVVVAGSTGTNKATARLIAAVAGLPRGAVVLPGLDMRLDQESWTMIGGSVDGIGPEPAAGHAQASLHRLLKTIGLERGEVTEIGAVPAGRAARGRLVSEALRPADSTDRWRLLGDLDRAAALQGLTMIEAVDEREEALAIAIALREVLEGPGTAALVTPDRELARRVREDLMRWSIDIEESSGAPLGQTPAGALARLVIDCALRDLAPVEILALLHHPDLRLGRPRAEVVRLARRLETAVLRAVLPPRALHDPAELLARARRGATQPHAPQALTSLSENDFAELAAFLEDVLAALAPLRALGATASLPAWLAAHESSVAGLLRDQAGEVAMTGPGFAVLAALFEELDAAADPAIRLDCPGYAALFDRLAAETPVRGPNRSHPRIKILGLLEARLLSADRVILGGLDEAVWPPQARTDPFLNRPMRAALGLTPPERRIGRTAHDFEMALSQAEVLITRAAKRGGAPTVPSRFVQRLAAVAGDAWHSCRSRGEAYLTLARALDKPARARVVRRPSPRPLLELRPKSLSVTRVEVLRRDPYSIYAERILRLVPPQAIAVSMGAREFGTEFHKAIAAFSKDDRGDRLLSGAAEALADSLRNAFAIPLAEPGFRSFQWPRIERWTRAFLAWEAMRRSDLAEILVEEKGKLPLRLADGSTFTLTAEADRIEVDRSGRVTVIDFKTGAVPSLREVKAGFAPQLTLEAEMAAQGAFASLGFGRRVGAAFYVKFANSDEVKALALHWKDDPPFDEVVAVHREELVALLNAFRDPAIGYVARPFPKFASRFGPYDHLSRVKEWSATSGVEDADEAGAGE